MITNDIRDIWAEVVEGVLICSVNKVTEVFRSSIDRFKGKDLNVAKICQHCFLQLYEISRGMLDYVIRNL
jgi:hypothetical protein